MAAGKRGLVDEPVTEAAVAVRQLHQIEEFSEAVALQREIWGFEELELLPVRLFVVAAKVGGQVFGAFDGRKMVGFCLAIPGLKPGPKTYLHSHMMGVLAEYRNLHVGRALKLAQRDEALSRGIDLIEWTFDPLEIKNAYFNTERLGAIVRRYVLNQYGTTTSPLHGGMPTDRCVAEWWIASDWASETVAGRKPRTPVEARIEVPVEIAELRTQDPKRAREIQTRVTAQFIEHFDCGLVVVGLERSDKAGTYLLGQWK